jgi:Kae1-associated kinase Bud32
MEKLFLGAEAEIKKFFLNGKKVVSKKRISKKYRDTKLDFSIRKKRTKSEAKIINLLYNKINVPKIINVNEKECEIIMDFIKGKQLKQIIEKNIGLCLIAGQEIRKIHDSGIIHGDLTTSNIIVQKENNKNKLFFIDFGLGFFSKKIEDKATDLIVFKKTFNATHSKIKNNWGLVLQGYDPEQELINRMQQIEKRVRYH